MALTATTAIEAESLELILLEILTVSAKHPSLTPRNELSLRTVANCGDLITLWNDGTLAGWGVRENLAPGIKEVGLMFIKPELRTPVAFAELARELCNDDATLIFASYDSALIRFVVAKHGFKKTSLLKIALVSRGVFITKRLGKTARNAVREHTSRAKPLFAIRDAR